MGEVNYGRLNYNTYVWFAPKEHKTKNTRAKETSNTEQPYEMVLIEEAIHGIIRGDK